MNQVKRLDLRCSELCLLHDYGWLQARISRLVSRTGDGPLYLLLALALLGLDGERGREFLLTGLQAFAIELPLYWLLKNSIRRERPNGLPVFIRPSRWGHSIRWPSCRLMTPISFVLGVFLILSTKDKPYLWLRHRAFTPRRVPDITRCVLPMC